MTNSTKSVRICHTLNPIISGIIGAQCGLTFLLAISRTFCLIMGLHWKAETNDVMIAQMQRIAMRKLCASIQPLDVNAVRRV